MVKCLQLDGVDDHIQSPSMTLDKVEIDVIVEDGTGSFEGILFDGRTGLSSGYLFGNGGGGGVPKSNYTVNGISATTNPLSQSTLGTRTLIAISYPLSPFTDDITIGANYLFQVASHMKGKTYKITCSLGGVVKALYDMSTESVQDQSGNGNHATLTGGTWVDDGTGGGGTGTSGSISYSTKNIIYRTSFNNYDSKQQIYFPSFRQHDTKQTIYSTQSRSYDTKIVQYRINSDNYDSKQRIYNSSLSNYDLKQSIYNNTNINYPTKQTIYNTTSTIFGTLQQLIDGGFVGSLSLDTKLILFANGSKSFDNKQIIYNTTSSPFSMKQSIYNSGQSVFSIRNQIYRQSTQQYDLKQIIHKLSNVEYQLKQAIYSTGSVNYDTLQQLLSDYFVYSQVLKYELSVANKSSFNININDLPMMYQVDILRKLQSETGISGERVSFDLKI